MIWTFYGIASSAKRLKVAFSIKLPYGDRYLKAASPDRNDMIHLKIVPTSAIDTLVAIPPEHSQPDIWPGNVPG
jgi:hypothetical protein